MSSRDFTQNQHRHDIRTSGLLALAALILSVLYGVSLGLSISPLVLIAAPLALLVAVLTLVRPQYAAAVLLAVEWGFIADILVHFHGVPSITKMLVVGLASILVWQRFTGRRVPLLYDPIIWWMLAYWVITCLGLWYAREPDRTMFMVIDVAKQLVMFTVLTNLLRTAKSFELAVWLLLGVAALLGTLTVYQEATHSYHMDFGGLARMEIGQITEDLQDRPRAGGTTGSPNPYALQLLVLVPIGLWAMLHGGTLLRRAAGGYATAAALAGIGLSFSRSMYIGLAVVLLAYALYIRLSPRYLLLVVPLMGVLFSVAPPELTARLTSLEMLLPSEGNVGIRDEASFKGRSVEMLMAVLMFVDHPILGVGGANYPAWYPEYIRATGSPVRDRERTPHSYYLEIAAEHGLIGFVIWSGILLLVWLRLSRARRLFRAAGQHRIAELASALQLGYLGFLVGSLFLHAAYPQFFWLQVGMAVALASIARRSALLPTMEPERSPAPASLTSI